MSTYTFEGSRTYTYALFTDYVGGFLGATLHGLPVECKPVDLAYFNPPSGQTCIAYAGDWVASSGGYLINPNAISDCESPAVTPA